MVRSLRKPACAKRCAAASGTATITNLQCKGGFETRPYKAPELCPVPVLQRIMSSAVRVCAEGTRW